MWADHIRMNRNIRWAFSVASGELSGVSALPLRALVTRLAAGDVERVGPRVRARASHRRTIFK